MFCCSMLCDTGLIGRELIGLSSVVVSVEKGFCSVCFFGSDKVFDLAVQFSLNLLQISRCWFFLANFIILGRLVFVVCCLFLFLDGKEIMAFVLGRFLHGLGCE